MAGLEGYQQLGIFNPRRSPWCKYRYRKLYTARSYATLSVTSTFYFISFHSLLLFFVNTKCRLSKKKKIRCPLSISFFQRSFPSHHIISAEISVSELWEIFINNNFTKFMRNISTLHVASFLRVKVEICRKIKISVVLWSDAKVIDDFACVSNSFMFVVGWSLEINLITVLFLVIVLKVCEG